MAFFPRGQENAFSDDWPGYWRVYHARKYRRDKNRAWLQRTLKRRTTYGYHSKWRRFARRATPTWGRHGRRKWSVKSGPSTPEQTPIKSDPYGGGRLLAAAGAGLAAAMAWRFKGPGGLLGQLDDLEDAYMSGRKF